MRIDPATGPLHAFASQLAIRAHRRGVVLDVDIAEAARVRRGELLPLRTSANRAISHAMSGVPARLSARLEGEVLMVRLVVAVAEVDQVVVVERADVQGLSWDADPADSTIILEASYSGRSRSLIPMTGSDD
jgi:hypothetical protein